MVMNLMLKHIRRMWRRLLLPDRTFWIRRQARMIPAKLKKPST